MKNLKFDEVKTQTDAIIWHLQNYGKITSWEAIKEYGCTRLASVIFNLKERGLTIRSVELKVTNKFGRNVNVAEYHLEENKIGIQSKLF
jgi:hypothetical protein